MKGDQKLRTLLFAAYKSYNWIFYYIIFTPSDATYSVILPPNCPISFNNFFLNLELENKLNNIDFIL